MRRVEKLDAEIASAEGDLKAAVARLTKANHNKSERPIAVMITLTHSQWTEKIEALDLAGLRHLAGLISEGIAEE